MICTLRDWKCAVDVSSCAISFDMSASVIRPKPSAWSKAKVCHSKPFAIALSGPLGLKLSPLALQLASYLAEFDEVSEGHWAVFDDAVTRALGPSGEKRSSACRCLKGSCPCTANSALPSPTITKIAESGRAILIQQDAIKHTQSMARVFRVLLFSERLGADDTRPSPYHLSVNMTQLQDDIAVRVIGDSALEWACFINRANQVT